MLVGTASELIAFLQKLVSTYGDAPVRIGFAGHLFPVYKVSHHSEHGWEITAETNLEKEYGETVTKMLERESLRMDAAVARGELTYPLEPSTFALAHHIRQFGPVSEEEVSMLAQKEKGGN